MERMMVVLLVIFGSHLNTLSFADQNGRITGEFNTNYEKINCHCPSCVAAHKSWAVACGMNGKESQAQYTGAGARAHSDNATSASSLEKNQ